MMGRDGLLLLLLESAWMTAVRQDSGLMARRKRRGCEYRTSKTAAFVSWILAKIADRIDSCDKRCS